MKNLKHKLAVVLLSCITLITTACSSQVSNDEVIKKVYESTTNIKSADMNLDLDMEISADGENLKTSLKGKSTFSSDPLAMSMDIITSAFGKEVNVKAYLKDGYMYLSNPEKDGEWIKTNNGDIVKQIQEQQKNLTSDKLADIFKNSSDKIKVEEKDGKYYVTYNGDGSEYKDIFISALGSTIQDSAALAELKNNVKFKSVHITYVVEKNNYSIVEQKMDMEFEITESGKTATSKVKGTTKYSNVNNVKEIVLPEEAKSAKDLADLEKEENKKAENKKEDNKEEENKKEYTPIEYKSALNKAEFYSNNMYMSKKAIFNQLTSEYGEKFSKEAANYAVDNLKADYNKNALKKALSYQNDMSMSAEAIRNQLTSEYGEQFTQEEADYAIKNLPK